MSQQHKPAPPLYHPQVRQTSHPLHFEVQSANNEHEWHNVDVSMNRFNGFCTCPHYMMRLDKLVAQQGHAASDRTRCKHIKAARTFFCNVWIRAVRQDYDKQQKSQALQRQQLAAKQS